MATPYCILPAMHTLQSISVVGPVERDNCVLPCRNKLSKLEWKYIIIDEAQRMKDRESKLSQVGQGPGHCRPWVVGVVLTATRAKRASCPAAVSQLQALD